MLAVAFLGALMLIGRLPVREGFRVVLGCFVLLAAPAIAAGLMWGGENRTAPVRQAPIAAEEPPRELPPAEYDPYSGA